MKLEDVYVGMKVRITEFHNGKPPFKIGDIVEFEAEPGHFSDHYPGQPCLRYKGSWCIIKWEPVRPKITLVINKKQRPLGTLSMTTT